MIAQPIPGDYSYFFDRVYDREASGESVPNPIDANPMVKSQFLDVYTNIGESDSLYGAIILYSPQEELRRRLYEHEGHWDKALSEYKDICYIGTSLSLCVIKTLLIRRLDISLQWNLQIKDTLELTILSFVERLLSF